MIAAALGALFFGLAGYIGVLLGQSAAERLQRFDDGPPPGDPPVPLLVAGAAAIGAIVATHAVPAQLPAIAVVVTALAAVWCTDVRTGIVPDLFTLGPLAVLIAIALLQHQWWLVGSAALALLPFAIVAAISRGRGIGWGDVKLVALGGAVLGAPAALLVFAGACLLATLAAYLRGRTRGAIAFAPYLAAAIAVGIPLGVLR